MDRNKLLELMRDDFKAKDIKSLKRHFSMGQWFLTDEDKVKIETAIKKLEEEDLPDNVKYALKVLGGRVVDRG